MAPNSAQEAHSFLDVKVTELLEGITALSVGSFSAQEFMLLVSDDMARLASDIVC